MTQEGTHGAGGIKLAAQESKVRGTDFLTWDCLSFFWAPPSVVSTPFLGLEDRSRGACSSSSAEVPEKVGGQVRRTQDGEEQPSD